MVRIHRYRPSLVRLEPQTFAWAEFYRANDCLLASFHRKHLVHL
jgi:hypothetical protein